MALSYDDFKRQVLLEETRKRVKNGMTGQAAMSDAAKEIKSGNFKMSDEYIQRVAEAAESSRNWTDGKGPSRHATSSLADDQADLYALALEKARTQQAGLSVPEAIGAAAENGIWGFAKGTFDLGASKVGQGISSPDSERLLGVSAARKAQAYDALYGQSLANTWEGYRPGDGTLRDRAKSTLFNTYHSSFQQLLEGRGRLTNPALESVYKGSNALFHFLRNYALPRITGSDNPDENAAWLTGQAYGLADKAEEAISSVKPLQYVSNEKYQAAMQKSSPAAQVAGNVTNVVARMLPAISAAYLTKNPDAGLVAMSASAAGSAAEEAMKAGATPEQAYYIGLEKGYVEFLSEGMFDAIGAFGGGKISPTLRRMMKDAALTKTGRAFVKLANIGGENVEESVADWAAPGIEKAVMGQTLNNKQRAAAGLPEEDDDISFLQALSGQMPWTEQGMITLLSTLVLGGANNVIQNNVVTVPKEQAQEIVEIARNSGNQRLIALAEEYNQILERRGKLGAGKYNTLYEATRERAGEDFNRQMEAASVKAEHAQTGKQRERLDGELKDFFRKNLTEGELPDAVAEQMQKEYDMNPETGSAAFAYAAREAFQYGNLGLSLSEAKAKAQLSGSLTGTSFEHIWKLGAMQRVGGEEKGAGEVKNEVRAHLAKYGEEGANRLAAVHDGLTTAEEYAEIVDKAVFYAKNGADLQTVVEETRNESSTAKWAQDRELGKLTDEQIAVIQELGPQLAAQDRETVRKTAEAFAGIREAAAEANTLTQVNKQLAAARNGLESARTELQAAEKEMRQMQDSGAWSTEEEAYNAVVRRVEELDGIIENGEKLVRDLEAKRAEAQNTAPQKRKKGTVSFAEDVDQKNLNRQQKKNIAAVQALADAVNIDYVLYAGKQNEGGYYADGQIYMNINAAVDVTVNGQKTKMSIFGFTLSHELTHHLKKYAPEEYQALRDFVVEKIRAEKGEKGFSRLVQEQIRMEKSAKKLSYDQAVDEVVANSCLTMLRDSKTVKELARQNMTLAEKVVDFLEDFVGKIKAAFEGADIHSDHMLFNAAKAMEKEAEGMLQLWDAALKTADVNYNAAQSVGKLSPATGSEVQYMAVGYTTDNQPVAIIEEDILDGVPQDQWAKTTRNVMRDRFSEGIPIAGRLIKVNEITRSEYTKSKDTMKYRATDGTIYEDKMKAAGGLDDIILATTNYINEDLKHGRKDNFTEFARGNVLMRIGKNDYNATVIVGFTSGKNMVLYDLVEIVPTKIKLKQNRFTGTNGKKTDIPRDGSASKSSVPNKTATVKKNSEQFMAWDGVEERAVEHFGTTDDFRIAGYILGDGRMLDFSGAHWMEGYDKAYIDEWRKKNDIRQVDHEDVNEAFGDEAPSDSALAFIRRGNIRIAPEAPGLELYAKREPTAQQYAQIREFVEYINNRQDYFTNGSRLWIDLTTDRKQRERMSYTGEIRPERVVNDLKHFYKTGEIREQGASAWFMTWDGMSEDDLLDEIKTRQQERKGIYEEEARQKDAFDEMTAKLVDGSITPEEYKKWEDESGYGKAYTRRLELDREIRELYDAYDQAVNARLEEEEREAIKAFGLSEEEYFRKLAVKEFGYTPYFYDGAYLLPNGKLLNFSGEKGKHYGSRGQDHRAIEAIYASSERSDAMNRFINQGNIRMMPESPGMDMSTQHEPSAEQYATIRNFVRKYSDEGYLSIDFTGEDGNVKASLVYEENIRPDRVVNDIKHYYQTGEIREQGASAWFMTWDDQVTFDDLIENEQQMSMDDLIASAQEYVDFKMSGDAAPKIKGLPKERGPRHDWVRAQVLGKEAKRLLEGFTPDDWDGPITAEEIDNWMEPNIYRAWNEDLFSDSMEAMDNLYKLAVYPDKADAAFQLMEQIAETMSPLNQQVYTLEDSERAPAFAQYWNKRNPSVYYPGYKPGDLFEDSLWGEGKTAKEIEYLNELLNRPEVSPEKKAEAQAFLDRLTRKPEEWSVRAGDEIRDYKEVFYMSWDNDHNDWAPEFYSKLNRTVAEWTNDKGRPMPEKMGAGAVIPWLRGRGVKTEEIRWSGLQTWLEGRKSVTKDELAAYLAGNMIDIRTEVRGRNMPEYLYDVRYDPLQIGQEHFRDADELEKALDKIEDILYKREGKEVYVKTQINDDGVVFYYLKPNGEKVHVLRATMNDAIDSTKWSDYTMKGGYKYREILFVDPRSNYDNMSMRVHWERPGVLMHARVQDMEEVSEGKRVLFIEEIQSDWHNAGAKKDPILGKAAGFASDYDNSAADSVAKLIRERIAVQTEGPKFEDIDAFARSLLDRVHKADAGRDYQYSLSRVSILDWITHDNVGILDDNLLWLSDKEGLQESAEKLALSLMTEKEKDLVKRSRDTYRRVRELTVQEQEARAVMEERPPEAPFAGSSDTYHEYVMKHLLRLAAEGDYDAIGWTTAEQQAERWKDPDTERWEKSKESYRISYDQTIPKFMNKYTKQWGGKVGDMALAVPYTNGQETRVWSVEITPEMKKAVLHEGQPLFMSWDGTEDTEQEWQDRLEAYSRLEAEQAIQDQVFQSIRELTRSQKKSLAEIQKRLKIGKTPEARMDDVQRMARSLMSRYNSTMKEEDVVGEIARIWNYVLQDQDPSGNVVRNMAEELAEKIVDSAEVAVIDETEEETLKEIRNRIHGQKLVISADETGDIPGYANLAEFRKKNFGRFSVAGRNSDAVTDQHVPVDSLYEELRNSYGDYYFPESTNQGEMLGVLSGYFEATERQKANPFADSYGEAVEAIAGEISRSAWWDAVRLTPLTEVEQTKVQNAEGREIIQNLRDERKITKSQAEKLEKPMAAGEQLAEQAEALKAQIRELVEAGEMSKAEATELQANLLKMTRRVGTLEEQYRLLEETADKRVAQIREEGAAKVAEAIAKQQEKNAKNVQALKDHFKEVQKNARDRREESGNVKKYRKQITNQVEALRKWMMSPSNKNILQHIPAEIQKTVADFLESISLVSKTYLRTGGQQTTRADDRYLRSMKRMRDAIKANVNLQGQYSGYNDLPPDFVENFEKMIEQTEAFIKSNPGGFIVNRMTGAELRDLRDTLKILRKYITQMNEFHNNAMFQHAYEAGDDTILYLSQFAKSKSSGIPYRFMRFDYMRPSYAFEHFGKGGQSIEHEFREGQAVQAFLANEIIDFAKRTYTSKEVKEWSRENKTFELSDGQTVTVPVTHLMSLYCLNKREQARLHIYGDGIRIANFQNGKNVELDEGHLVSIPDVQKMIGALTERQKEVADKLQEYMSTEAAKWGNYVSMARFDVEQFTEENYFPINSDGRYLSTTADESPDNAGLYALLNSGFTKELKENARNRIILYNVFDVFANHTASMAQYRAFALPMLDALKWFNYKDPNTSVRAKLSSAFGAPLDERAGSGAKGYAEQFVINLLKAYNGTSAQGDPYDTTALKILHRYNGAAIAYNLRVIVQQPTAIARAAMILSPAKLTKGLGMSIAQLRKLAEEMEAHSGIAAWKALGFYDTNISRGLTDLIKQNPSILDRVMDFGTKGAEQADRFTWAAMWYAAKDTVKRGDYATEEEYFKAVTDLFEEVIYKTQVVDSLLTKAEFLRSKGAIARQLGSFMSEPSATMSMLADASYKFTDDLQRGMSRSEAWKKNGANIARTAAVYAVGQAILSAMQAVIDAWRDDDEYDPDDWLNNYIQKYLKAFKGNLVEEELIFGKIPVVSELYEMMKSYLDKFGVFDKLGIDIYGNEVTTGIAMYTKYLTKTIDILKEKIVDGKSNYTNYAIVYNMLRFASNISGMPFGTAWREIQDLWNNTVGYLIPNKKLVTYQRTLDKTYEEYIRDSGMAKKEYERILDEADSDGGTSPTQDELGAYLTEELKKGKINETQAQALWTSRWHSVNSTTFEKWREKGDGAKGPASGGTPAPMGYDSFSKDVPIYGKEKRLATYSAKPAGMTLERYAEILKAADTDANDSLKQDELGAALKRSVERREMSHEEAKAVWDAQGWSAKHSYEWWLSRH